MACCQHTIQQGHLKGFRHRWAWRPQAGANTALGKGRHVWKREREDPPQICERRWDGNTNRGEYPSMCQVGIDVRMSWQAFGALPSYPSSRTNTLLPCFEHMVHQRRHLATLTPGSCASSSPVGSLGTATSSTTCGSSRVKKASDELFCSCSCKLDFHPRDSL